MPIYEYRCADCGHVFEEIQQFSDPDPDKCPSCESKEVGRLISRSNFKLKGGGWYAENYSSTSPATESTTPSVPVSEPAPAGSESSSNSTDATPKKAASSSSSSESATATKAATK